MEHVEIGYLAMQSNTFTQVLLVEDDASMAAVYRSYLNGLPYQITRAETGKKALELLSNQSFTGVLLDLNLPDMHGLEILAHIRENEIATEVIVTTGDCSMQTVIDAMQAGARDYLVKPFNKDRLVTTLKNFLESQELKRKLQTYQEEIDRKQFCSFIGSSLAMQRVYQLIDSAASSKATIFITGESGTGKEVCAEAVHQTSERANGPFVALNCGAIPKDLMESEIFGHVKGAFTGAIGERDGCAKAAHKGTLFLDEICEMDMALQSKLLRFLQTSTIQKVGSDKTEKVDVRIVCATNKDPMEQVQAGNFREDLYYRLHVLPIHLPSLKERENDVIEIAASFLSTYSQEEQKNFTGFDSESELILSQYDWPGNVRQLQNVIRNIVVLCNGELVTTSMLPAPLDSDLPPSTKMPSSLPEHIQEAPQQQLQQRDTTSLGQSENQLISELIRPMSEVEKEAIERAIDLCGGNIPTAAHYLGISAATIYRKKNQWKETSL